VPLSVQQQALLSEPIIRRIVPFGRYGCHELGRGLKCIFRILWYRLQQSDTRGRCQQSTPHPASEAYLTSETICL